MTVYLIKSYLYDEDDHERDTVAVIGIASTKEKGVTLIKEWANDLVNNKEDGYKEIEEIFSDYNERTYRATDEFGDRWVIDVIILKTELDKIL